MEKSLSKDHSPHVTDERINTITALVGALLSALGAALLVSIAVLSRDWWKVAAAGVYSIGLVGLFVMSTLHHGINGSPRTNKVLRILDYCSIFVLIAGTVTPLVLVKARSILGWVLLAVVWLIAGAGIALVSSVHTLPRHITNTMFMVLGWMPVILLLITPMAVPFSALGLLAFGGLVYSAGFVIYASERPNWRPGLFGFHELWHSMVILAALSHFLFMYWYVI